MLDLNTSFTPIFSRHHPSTRLHMATAPNRPQSGRCFTATEMSASFAACICVTAYNINVKVAVTIQ
jgi:hypothetical protein